MSTYEATQAEQAAEASDLRAALAAVQAENLTLQVLTGAAVRLGDSAARVRQPWRFFPGRAIQRVLLQRMGIVTVSLLVVRLWIHSKSPQKLHVAPSL